MFTQASSLVAIVGGIVLVSSLLSAGALVATVVGEWCEPPSVECGGGTVYDISIFGGAVPSLGDERTEAHGRHPPLTLVLGGRHGGPHHGQPRGHLTLVHHHQRNDAAAAGAPKGAAGARAFGILRKLARR